MRILILGGSVFLGRHLVEVALRRNHRVTLFNRGQSNPELFPDVEKLRGDRGGDLDPLREKRWDAVIDTCGFKPAIVKASVEALKGVHYTFISTLSVYATWGAPDETAPLAVGDDYGPLKAQCEQVVPPLIIRPGLIVGPHDPSDRFTYWPARVRRGGAILAPGRPHRKIQYIDVRDLAEWTMRLVEGQIAGIYNAITPPGLLTMAQFLEECGGGNLVWMKYDEALVARKMRPYVDLPLWIPEVDDTFGCTRALQVGLTYRPLRETIVDTLRWDDTRSPGPRRAGLDAARETEMMKA